MLPRDLQGGLLGWLLQVTDQILQENIDLALINYFIYLVLRFVLQGLLELLNLAGNRLHFILVLLAVLPLELKLVGRGP